MSAKKPPYGQENPFVLADNVATRVRRARNAVQGSTQEAIGELQQLYEETPVKMPEPPKPSLNPFANLGTALGMAVTGQGAQYAQSLRQVAQAEAARQDQYRAQKLQALNYDALRKQNIGTAIAELRAEAGRELVDVEEGIRQAAERDEDRDASRALEERRVREQERRGAASRAGGGGKDFQEIYSDFIGKLTDGKELQNGSIGALAYRRAYDIQQALASNMVLAPAHLADDQIGPDD